MSLTLHEAYRPLYTSKARIFLLTGGRASMKSFHLSLFLTQLTMEAGHVALFTRYTMTSAHLSIIPEFTEKISLLNWQQHFKQTKDEVVNLHTGSRVAFRGIKTSQGIQTANLKSIQGLTVWANDETEELQDRKVAEDIEASVRKKGKQNRIIYLMNPSNKQHWVWERFFVEPGVPEGFCGEKDGVCYIHTDYRIATQFLDADYVASIERIKETNYPKYEHRFLGKWLDARAGVVFTNWKIGTWEDGPNWCWGMDFGFITDPTTLVRVRVDNAQMTIWVKCEYYATGATTDTIGTVINTYCKKNDLIVADNSEPRLITELNRAGANLIPARKNEVKVDLQDLLDWKIIACDEHTIKELQNYIWNDRKAGIPIDDYNHVLDAMRYAWNRLRRGTSGQKSFSV